MVAAFSTTYLPLDSVAAAVSTAPVELFGWKIVTPVDKYLFLLGVLIVFTLRQSSSAISFTIVAAP